MDCDRHSRRCGAELRTLVLGLALTGFAFSPYMGLSLALMVFVGIGQTARMTISNALIQYYSDPNYRGRVMSLYTMEEGLSSLGVFGAAMFASAVSAQWAIGVLAMVLVLLALLSFAFFPRIRKLD